MSEPCRCHECIVAGVDRPSVTIPGYRDHPSQVLHGRDLRRYYDAQDELRATMRRVASELATAAARLTGIKP